MVESQLCAHRPARCRIVAISGSRVGKPVASWGIDIRTNDDVDRSGGRTMRKALHRAVPIVVGACAAALLSATSANADVPGGFSAAPMVPFPQDDVSCELLNYCDSGLDLVVTGRSERMEPEFGGGFLTPNPALADN
ncbi:hypothetical protein [Mycolicibacterium sp. OfavD-34-C]|uniref:hypothetical protein n=1 Tax=Mycolicibacterium sp. OfavD-34-C TaxID=2917746 RepID=UPI001EF4BF49|nr:hypothetical protein [Mycolicibacterium sp. OfavD-34-C]MCG7582239.1 hypothetical protein [Mycolicibacterium sp. OfavD-34-C]